MKIVQPNYTNVLDFSNPNLQIQNGELSEELKYQLALAWAVCATSISNTITLVNGRRLIGNGVGQQGRFKAAKLALSRVEYACRTILETEQSWDPSKKGFSIDEHELAAAVRTLMRGMVSAGDSFYPFPDGPLTLINAKAQLVCHLGLTT